MAIVKQNTSLETYELKVSSQEAQMIQRALFAYAVRLRDPEATVSGHPETRETLARVYDQLHRQLLEQMLAQ